MSLHVCGCLLQVLLENSCSEACMRGYTTVLGPAVTHLQFWQCRQ